MWWLLQHARVEIYNSLYVHCLLIQYEKVAFKALEDLTHIYRMLEKLCTILTLNFVAAWIIGEWVGNSTRHRFEMRLLKILIGGASG